jgi:hypothetical protein
MNAHKHSSVPLCLCGPSWGIFIAATLLLASPAAAQAPGAASFRVYQREVQTGTVETRVSRIDGGWHIASSSRVAGTLNVTFKQLELRYDTAWRGRFMTMEVEGAKNRMLVHVSVGRNTTRTDIIRDKEARLQSHSVSQDTIFLPAGAFGAYEAVAARLATAKPGIDLPLFNVPVSETRGAVDAVSDESVRIRTGAIAVKRVELVEIRPQPTRVILWIDRGRLLRIDVPADFISVLRTDVLR